MVKSSIRQPELRFVYMLTVTVWLSVNRGTPRNLEKGGQVFNSLVPYFRQAGPGIRVRICRFLLRRQR